MKLRGTMGASRWTGLLAVSAGALTLAALFLPDVVTIRANVGDWKSTTRGLSKVASGTALAGRRGARLRFEGLRGELCVLRLHVSRHHPQRAVRLTVEGQSFVPQTVDIGVEPMLLSIPVATGREQLELRLKAVSTAGPARHLYRIDAIELERSPTHARTLARLLPSLVAGVVFLLLCREVGLAVAVLWGLLTAALATGYLGAVWDPLVQLQVRRPWLEILPTVGSACLWALAFFAGGLPRATVIAILGTAGNLYAASLGYGLLADDLCFVRHLSWGEWLSTLYGQWDPRGVMNVHHRPVVASVWAWDYWFWNTQIWGYHLTNVLIHAGHSVLAWRLLKRLGVGAYGALAGGLGWTAHPLGAASVAWLSERTDGLAAMFIFGALLLLTAARVTWRTSVMGLALAALALGSKELSVALPVLALALLWVAPDQDRSRRWTLVAATWVVAGLFTGLWAHIFPGKARAGLHTLADFLTPAALRDVAGMYSAAFFPYDIVAWRISDVDRHVVFLVGAVLLGPLYGLWLRSRQSSLAKLVFIGSGWPFVFLLPMLTLQSGVDLSRMGLLMGFGFALVWAVLVTRLHSARPWAAALLGVTLSLWFVPQATRAAFAWGPGGSIYSAVLQPGLQCLRAAAPQMQAVYRDQLKSKRNARWR